MYTYKDFSGSIPEIIKHFDLNINPRTVYDRMRRGVNICDALEIANTRNLIYNYKGFTGSVPEILKEFKCEIKLKTVYARLEKGLSIEDAIELSLRYNNLKRSKL